MNQLDIVDGITSMDTVLYGWSQWFWNDSFWLPQNVTWDDIKPTEEKQYANFNDLIYPLPLAVFLIFFRKLYERFVLEKIGRLLGIKDVKKRKAPYNEILERAYTENGIVQHNQIQVLAKRLNWSERQIERWLRYRSAQNKPTLMNKFTESGWRVSYYLVIFIYGLSYLWNKPWLWNSRECWIGYPMHVVTRDLWWHYIMSLAFYWSLFISQFVDVIRKDFWAMFIHHMVTISLLSFSWAVNMTRIGSIILIVHDFADPFLDLAKMAKYVNNQFMCNIIFSLFTVNWIISRLVYYPYVILHSTIYEAADILHHGVNTYEAFPANIVFNVLLGTLQVLQVVWTFFIFRVLYRAFHAGQLVRDERSEDSCSISESSDHVDDKKEN